MNIRLKKFFVLFFVFILGTNISTGTVKAAGVSISIALSSSSISVGKSVTATINVSGADISAYTIYVTYNSSVLQFNSASGSAQAYGSGGTLTLSGTGGGLTSLTFTAIANGSSSISTSGTEAYNINLEQLSISHAGVVVKVETPNGGQTTEKPNTTEDPSDTTDPSTETTTEEDDRSSNCNLKSLQISPGKLEPAFSPSVTSYFVQVDENVTSMVVSATTEDDKASTKVWGAGLIEPGENTVKITVTAENGAVKVYNIRVVAGEALGDATVTIGDKLYTVINEKKNIDIPEGFSSTTINYKDWEILAYESPNQKVVLVCLMDDEGNKSLFVYDKDFDTFSPYLEFSSNYNRYFIKSVPDGIIVPDGFVEKSFMINDNEIKAYQWADTEDENIFLVYAVNIEKEEGFYLYDTVEGAFIRYVPTIIVNERVVIKEVATVTEATPATPVKTTPVDEGFFTKKVLKYFVCGLGAIAALLLIILITVSVKFKNVKDALEDADAMVSQLASDKVNSKALSVANNIEVNGMESFDEVDKNSIIDGNYEDFARASQEINTKIKEHYSAEMDSAFATEDLISSETIEMKNENVRHSRNKSGSKIRTGRNKSGSKNRYNRDKRINK